VHQCCNNKTGSHEILLLVSDQLLRFTNVLAAFSLKTKATGGN